MEQHQNKYTSKLAGQTVLIIGGSSGLGFGVAEACIENSVARVIISSSQEARIAGAIDRLKTAYPNASGTQLEGYACDLGDASTLEANVRKLFDQIDTKIDHIVYTAGDRLTGTPLSEIELPALQQAGMVRFFAPFFVAKHGVGHMNPGPASSITLTGGAAGEKPVAGIPAIAAYSAGLNGLARALALELRPVRVNLVSPSSVDTELWDTVLGPDNADKKAAMFEHQKTKVATGVIGTVEDVVESYLYSMKDRNVTGVVISSSGGWLIM